MTEEPTYYADDHGNDIAVGPYILKWSMWTSLKQDTEWKGRVWGRFPFSSTQRELPGSNPRPLFSTLCALPLGRGASASFNWYIQEANLARPARCSFFLGRGSCPQRAHFCSGSATCSWLWNLPNRGSSHQALMDLFIVHYLFQWAFPVHKENGLPSTVIFDRGVLCIERWLRELNRSVISESH